ncbi:MAG: DUF3750 domain-containing protein [Candidatus Nomurabacteria bacterium]|nr:DUF3750 domain-containing protein [Candidatus Nomurabacteria bacterium]
MSQDEFKKLIKEDKYQVFVFACPAYFPFNFARHPWFVLNKKGNISRYEVVHKKNCCPEKCFGYLHLNALPPYQGVKMFSFSKKHWDSDLLGFLEGDENSPAQKCLELIEKSKELYPYTQTYSLRGPNSNTYLNWVLKQFPEFSIKLSWRFIGKSYKPVV